MMSLDLIPLRLIGQGMIPTRFGYFDWEPSQRKGLQVQTWFRIDGDLCNASKTPLLVLHGGPGAAHNYVLSLADLAGDRPVVFYDQLGCGLSTHLPGNKYKDLWSTELFVEELDKLAAHLKLSKFHLLGQSWGGYLAQAYTIQHPRKVRGLVLADTLNDFPTAIAGLRKWIEKLPPDMLKAIDHAEATGDFEAPAYLRASEEFYKRHVCRLDPNPPDVTDTFRQLAREPTVYNTLNGPSEFHIIAKLKNATLVPSVEQIQKHILVVHGAYDELLFNQDQMIASLKSAASLEHRQYAHSSHMPHWEDREEYMVRGKTRCFLQSFIQRQVHVGAFMDKVDGISAASSCLVS